MPLYEIDPLSDPRWDQLVAQHPAACCFHSRGWLTALYRTYNYRPLAFTTSRPTDPLANAIPFCEIKSFFTGNRMVSLPFSDHSEFLTSSSEESSDLLASIVTLCPEGLFRYLEVRPLSVQSPTQWRASQSFLHHTISLEDTLPGLYSHMHKGCIQRKIRRAEKEHLVYSEGSAETHLRAFYRLLVRTRRRHGCPPQPYKWFQNLLACTGSSSKIRIASKDGRPVAAFFTVCQSQRITYKYGCSDERYSHLGGVPFLFWQLIQEAKATGISQLDLGRSDLNNEGLIAFKERLGARRREIHYWRTLESDVPTSSVAQPSEGLRKMVFGHLPGTVLSAAGRVLYRHIG